MSSLSDLPPPVKLGALLGGGGILGASVLTFADRTLPWYLVLAFALLTLAIVVGVLWLIVWLYESRQGQKLDGDIRSSAQTGGEEAGDSKALLDHQRAQFLDGLNRYQHAEGDVRKKPWFLIMGHPGSGKTYAVAQSDIEWVEGLNSAVGGAGGTRSMDWWFAREAIILDTAGRYVEGARKGSSDEECRRIAARQKQLQTFLKRLKERKPHCPINGLILVIAVTDLLLEDEKERESRAQDLKATLNTVKEALDVRFPVIVWITKCDKIAGFRQYFRSFACDPSARNQMIGWSNPSTDFNANQFNADDLETALKNLGRAFREQRWNLLGQLVPHEETFADAAGGLYCFPEAWERTISPLRQYLTSLFASGGPKAPYFRGVYFNSAVTEGEELDEQLATLTQQNLRSIWDQENEAKARKDPLYSEAITYFIRDTLTEKLFKETGLVSRYSNAVTMLKRNQLIVLGCSAVVLLLMVGWAWFAQGRLRDEILAQSQRWVNLQARIAPDTRLPQPDQSVQEEELKIVRRLQDTSWTYSGQREIPLLDATTGASNSVVRERLLSFYAGLLQQATKQIQPSLLFRMFPPPMTDVQRRQRLWVGTFRHYGFEPLLQAAETGLGATWDTNASPAVLDALLRWDAVVSTMGQTGHSVRAFPQDTNLSFAWPLLQAVTLLGIQDSPDFKPEDLREDARLLDELCAGLLRLSETNLPDLVQWSRDTCQRGVASGLTQLTQHANAAYADATDKAGSLLPQLQQVRAALEDLTKGHNRLANRISIWAKSPGFTTDADQAAAKEFADAMAGYRTNYLACLKGWEAVVARASAAPLTARGALRTWQSNAQVQALAGLRILDGRLAAPGLTNSELGKLVAARSVILETAISNNLNVVAESLRAALEKGDEEQLNSIEGGASLMSRRYELYGKAIELFSRDVTNAMEVASALASYRAKAGDLLTNLVHGFVTRPGVSNMSTVDLVFSNAVANLARIALAYQTSRLGRVVETQLMSQLSSGFPLERRSASRELANADSVKTVHDRLSGLRAQLAALDRETTEVDNRLAVTRLLLDTTNWKAKSLSIWPLGKKLPEGTEDLIAKDDRDKIGDQYRMLRVNDGDDKEEMDILLPNLQAPLWRIPLDSEQLRMSMARKTLAGGSFSEIELAGATGPWAPLRWVIGVVQQHKSYRVIETTNDTLSLVVRLQTPEGTPFAVGVAFDGSTVQWKQWLGIQ